VEGKIEMAVYPREGHFGGGGRIWRMF